MANTGSKLIASWFVFYLTALVSCSEEVDVWNEFKSNFKKNYSSPDEESYRRQIFMDNNHYINQYNRNNAQNSFTQGINHLSDLTLDEINQQRNGFRLGGPIIIHQVDSLLQTLLVALNQSATSSDAEEPGRAWYEDLFSQQQLDWRNTGRVSKVKDQGACGSCWAFATTGALEAITASRGHPMLLSEQNLVDCSRRYGNHGCSGGLMDAALRYVRDHGIMTSADYPYTAKDGQCKSRRDKSVLRVRGAAVLPHGNEALLRILLAATGPIPIAIDASPRSFHSYKSGIYDDRACRSSPNALNHAVLLVGYGTDRQRDYWIVKNSWGTNWGDRGYIKIARNRRNLCGVATYAVLPIT